MMLPQFQNPVSLRQPVEYRVMSYSYLSRRPYVVKSYTELERLRELPLEPTPPAETVAEFAKRIGEQMRRHREKQQIDPTYRGRRTSFRRGVFSQSGNA